MSQDRKLRIDRWLFFCRFYKTRVLAAAAVAAGHVCINAHKAAPSSRVSCGDVVTLTRDRMPYALTVIELPLRRGPASEAQRCYVEDEIVVNQRIELQQALRRDRTQMPTTAGRPDKHTRRLLRSRNRQHEK